MGKSEFQQFLETLRLLGITFTINWHPTKDEWQQHVLDAGYNITVLSCTVVEIDSSAFLFANGQADWRNETGFGPSGVFLLRRDAKTGVVTNRKAINFGTGESSGITGLAALRLTYDYRI